MLIATTMTVSAWLFMGATWAVTLSCTIYCFAKLLSSDRALGDSSDEASSSGGESQ